jgi:hypothetical protein
MNILTDQQRDKLIEALRFAPDDVLINAVTDMKQQRHQIQNSFRDIQGFIGLKPLAEPPPDKPMPAAAAAKPAGRPDKNPGKSTITKIGGNTTNEILNSLAVNVQPAVKYTEHLKLLHNRGLVKFDGVEYYL